MIGNKSSILKNIFLNPLVWAGFLLTILTLNYEKDVFAIFFLPKTYELLAIGAAAYTALFGIHYTENSEHIDWAETLMEVIYTMGIIFMSWLVSLTLIMSYRQNGENLKMRMERKLSERTAAHTNNISNSTAPSAKDAEQIERLIRGMNLDSGQSYVITPQADGSIAVEIVGE